MQCEICNLSSQETDLFEGVYETQIIFVCPKCAEAENIPLIKKPSDEQLQATEQRRSVRERLERLSFGPKHYEELSHDQKTANKNLAKIKFPQKKQHSELLLENYYWILKMARRRKKLTIQEISKATSIPEKTLEGLEKGLLPKDLEEPIKKLEFFLNIKLLRSQNHAPHFILPEQDKQARILAETEEKMQAIERGEPIEETTEEPTPEKIQKLEKLERGELDLSKRKEIQNITLADLQEIKRKRDLKAKQEQEEKAKQELFGEELDLEELEELEGF